MRIRDESRQIFKPTPKIEKAFPNPRSLLIWLSACTTVIPTKSPKIHTGTCHRALFDWRTALNFGMLVLENCVFSSTFFSISSNLPSSFLKSDRILNWFVSDHFTRLRTLPVTPNFCTKWFSVTFSVPSGRNCSDGAKNDDNGPSAT